ncbi:hypothetical protein, partial [Neorhizobium galegae]
SKLTDAEVAEFNRRQLANCQLYGLNVLEAETKGDGRVARVAAACALNDVRNRRQTIWSKR